MVPNPSGLPQQRRRGTVAVLVAICLTVILGIVAIAVDGGLLMEDRRQVQAAADAAALAAAIDLYNNYSTNYGLDPSGTAAKSAQTTAAANGFANNVNATVVVNIPPKSGPFAGNTNGYAEVIIQTSQQRAFSRIFGNDNLTVTGRAVARGQWV